MKNNPIVVYPPDQDKDDFSFYADVAQMFWPGDFEKDNHLAQEEVVKLAHKLWGNPFGKNGYLMVRTPHGDVEFDSESGGMAASAKTHEALKDLIELIIYKIVETKVQARIEAF